MQRPSPFSRAGNPLQVQMTPMIDVVFQLLVFFVCTAGFLPLERSLHTSLSIFGAGQSDVPPPELAELEDVVVRVTNDGGQTHWTVNERPYASLAKVGEVLATLARLRSDLPVVLDIGGDVEVGHCIDLYDLCLVAGFQQVQFAAPAEL